MEPSIKGIPYGDHNLGTAHTSILSSFLDSGTNSLSMLHVAKLQLAC